MIPDEGVRTFTQSGSKDIMSRDRMDDLQRRREAAYKRIDELTLDLCRLGINIDAGIAYRYCVEHNLSYYEEIQKKLRAYIEVVNELDSLQ